MRKIYLSLTLLTLLSCVPAFSQGEAMGHGGGNGGDDLEMTLKKRSLQIGSFVKSTVGSQVFDMINADSVIKTINKMDIDIISGNVSDKYGILRTCVNVPEQALIICNLGRINELTKNKQDDILTGLLFHEILGLMGLELGHQDNVSMYPISSKIVPYHSIVAQTPISEADIRPEYYGLDSRSYGITLINKKTQESIRMICLNDNVEVHRCRNYSVVRNANEFQAPLVPEISSFHPSTSYLDLKLKGRESELANKVLNLDNDLSLIGKTISVKEKDYQKTIKILTKALKDTRSPFLCQLSKDYTCRSWRYNVSSGILNDYSAAEEACRQLAAPTNDYYCKTYKN